MKITRRHVLAATGALGAAVVVASGAAVVRWWDRPPGAGLKTLSEDEHAFVQAMAEAWMPPGGEPAISGAEARVGDFLDELLVTMAPTQTRLLKLLMHALDARTVPLHLASYQHLPLATRTEVLRGWRASSLYPERQAVAALLALIAFGYETHPEVSRVFAPMFGCGFGR